MAVLVVVLVTATLYFFLFRFAVSRLEDRPAPAAEPPAEPRADPGATVEDGAWTDLDDRQLDRLLRESSP